VKDVSTHHHGALAGVSAGTAGVLFAFGVLVLAWHRVAGQVSMAVAVLAYAVMFAVAVIVGAATWYVVLWVRHRARNPELLARRQQAPAPVPQPAEIEPARPAAIEPPRVYLNVTDDQLDAIIRAIPGTAGDAITERNTQ
jgi:hypothetical protein